MKYSLKFKILLGIAAVLLISVAFNLIYSYRLFVEDKTSYIFETGLKKSESISDQINFKIADLVTKTEFQSLLLESGNINLEKYINSQDDLAVIGQIKLNEKVSISKQYLNSRFANKISTKLGINTSSILDEVVRKSQNPIYQNGNISWFYSPNKNVRTLIHFSKKSRDGFIVFSVADLTNFFDTFTKDSSYQYKIISLREDLSTDDNEWSKDLDFNKSKKGAFEKVFANQNFLVSYVFANKDILVMASIEKDKAFGITNHLILKTILFAIFLLGISMAIGIYFSSGITFPIKKLTEGAEQIAQGNFDNQVSVDTTDEIKLLANTFNFMSSEISELLKNKEELIQKLEDYNKNLEEMVAQRTKELKEANDFMALMVNSLDQGLLVFDSELNCHPMFTKACEPIFNISPLNKTFPEVLKIENEDEINSLKQWATVVFNEMLPFESAVDLGPRSKVTGNHFSDPHYKYVQLDYYPMRDADEKISNIVLIATDKTNEIQAKENAKEKEAYVSMILKILNNKTQFESFINEVEDIFDQFKEAYSLENNSINFELCMMLFHTLNGGFSIYNINKLQAQAREYESEISNIKDSNPEPSEYIPFLINHVETLKNEFLNFRIELDQLIGTKFSTNQPSTDISRDKILHLKKLVLETKNDFLIDYYNENFVKTSVINYFKAYDDLCKNTAVKIGKEFKGIVFTNPDLKVEAEPLMEFFNVLVHLFRNCLDHGIEDSYTRSSMGKTSDGHIGVSFSEFSENNQKFLSVTIEDDGAGIDPQKIRNKLSSLNPDADYSNLSDKEIIYKIFEPFFSTRDEVTFLSGRGVGMSAIKDVVDKLGGQIEIESHINRGSTFNFIIPTSFQSLN